jgi:hypothetical protein
MAIKKQEFYEGAALHLLIRAKRISIAYEPPFFIVEDTFALYLKYSTKGRSPWGFTLMPAEQVELTQRSTTQPVVVGLICGSDGVVAVPFSDLLRIAPTNDSSVHIACYRDHGKQYRVSGPQGVLDRKIPPSSWQRLLQR